MAASAAFLAARRTEILLLSERTDYLAAIAAINSASASDYGRYWQAAFNDAQPGLSPAFRFRKAIRGLVSAAADGTQSPADLEGAYQTLVSENISKPPAPSNFNEDKAILQQILIEDKLS